MAKKSALPRAVKPAQGGAQRWSPWPAAATSSVITLMGAGMLLCSASWAQSAKLPSSALPASALPKQATDWLQSGSGASYQVNGNNASVKLNGTASILHWNSMDVGSAASLSFAMPNATSRVLNKVDGGAINNQTTINGLLNSNGQVYIYNPNGVVFGKTAMVDVGALVATSLKINDQRFLDGLLSPSAAANFAVDPLLGTGFVPGAVVVEGDKVDGTLKQAAIKAAQNGFILLMAPTVSNSGQLSAPDGQVLMAAGSKVFLAAPLDSNMRGLRVEVNSEGLGTLAGGASVTNTALGQIGVDRGNITLAGLSVNQMGMASASTSVNLNGTIYLKATDGASKLSALSPAQASVGGKLVLSEGSVTRIDIVDDGTTAAAPPAGQPFKASAIELTGKNIELQKNAQVLAPGGNVTLTARANPSAQDIAPNSSSVVLGEGSVIDVSGTTDTVLAMESNVIAAELRGNELADNILLRNSAVRGQTVYLDKRKLQANIDNGIAGGTSVANVKGYLNLVEHKVGEYAAAGGNITISSEGSITQKSGNTLNVSGGWVDYAGGNVNTSKLTMGGKVYDIESASASLPYDGVFRPGASASNYEAGYRDGKSAGTIRLNAPTLSQQGKLKGSVTSGYYQRDVMSSNRPLGGQLLIGEINDSTLDATTGRANFGNLDLMSLVANITVDSKAAKAGDLVLDVNALNQAGFTRISALTSGDVNVKQDISTSSGSQLRLGAGGDLNWGGQTTSHGGSITATAQNKLTVADGASMDLSGTWQNDGRLANPVTNANGQATGDIVTKGGTVRLYGNQVKLGNDVSLDVSGGAWLNASGALSTGSAGGITAQATTVLSSLDGSLQLGDRVSFAGYGVSSNGQTSSASPSGGSLSLTGRNVTIGHAASASASATAAAAAAAGDLYLADDFFAQGGFASRSISANGNLTVQAGAQIAPSAQVRVLHGDYLYAPASATGSDMKAVADVGTLALAAANSGDQRQASGLTLRATGRSQPGDGLGVVKLGTDASIHTDPGASVTLSADRQVLVNGTIETPGGTQSLLLLRASPDSSDNLYDPSNQIWLGSHAKLLAQGSTQRVFISPAGVASGQVLDGGTVRLGRSTSSGLGSAVGYVVAEKGSLIDVSGTHMDGLQFKSGAYLTEPASIGSAGGTIDIRVREGLVLAGDLRGTAGNAQVKGGTFNVQLDREGNMGGAAYPQADRRLVLQESDASLPATALMGSAILGLEATGKVPLKTLRDGGFANLAFKSQDDIVLAGAGAQGAGNVSVTAGSSISLNAPNVVAASDGLASAASTQAVVAAPYVVFGNSDVRYQSSAVASDGKASLNVNANTLDVTGQVATQGFGTVNLHALNDMRLIGSPPQDNPGLATGSLQAGAQLNLTAAQIYPTTLSQFNIGLNGSVVHPETTLQISASGQAPEMIYSAAGSVTASADHIVQAGKLAAPWGSITLDAAKEIRFDSGSITSVAGEGTVPLGSVVNGSQWTYDVAGQTLNIVVNPSSDASKGEISLPVKSIQIASPSVNVKSGAVVDASGGGKLYTYEFTPGPGGSADVLQSSGGSKNTTFAINVNYKSDVAPQDWQNGSDGLKAGDKIYLSGGNGLPAGYYTLLPAHYALLSGGYLVESARSSTDMSARDNRLNADNSYTMAGYRFNGTDGRGDARNSGFVVTPQSVVRQRSEFHDYDADSFFRAQAVQARVSRPALPADGGSIALDVQTNLALLGTVKVGGSGSGNAKGINGTVDIAAPSIQVTASRQDSAGGVVSVAADDLVAMQADSILLGGLRKANATGGADVQVKADTVRIDNNAAHPLNSAEVIAVASDTVQLTQRAVVNASQASDRTAQTLRILANGGNTDGALLRVSSGAQVGVQRDATQAQARTGRLEINRGAQVLSSGSANLDATRSMLADGRLQLADQSALSVRAPLISLGDAAPANTEAVRFDNTGIAALNRLADLSLTSSSVLDVYGAVNLGTDAMKSLQVSAATVQGHNASAQWAAQTVKLSGAGTSTETAQRDASTGQLVVKSQNIEIGSGAMRIKGFGLTSLQASKEIAAVGRAGAIVADNTLQAKAARISAQSGADASLAAGAALQLQSQSAAKTDKLSQAGLGGSWRFEGQSIDSSVSIAAPSGSIAMLAEQGVQINAGTLDVSGQAVDFGTGRAYVPAGSVSLDGGAGNVVLAAGAAIDLSAQGAAAGRLEVSATGSASSRVQLDGTLKAKATSATAGDTLPQHGSWVLDVAQAPDATAFAQLNNQLNDAGFTQSRQVRVRSGDLTVGAGSSIQAREIVLSADNGNIGVAGTLDASGAAGGSIALYAAQSSAAGNKGRVSVQSGAQLLARATQEATSAAGSTGDGGRVLLSAANSDGAMAQSVNGGASIAVAAGSLIDVSAAGQGQGGTVLLSAPRVSGGASSGGVDVAVSQLQGTVRGSRATQIEGVKVYKASSISEQADSSTNLNASTSGKMAVEAADFQTHAAAIKARLARSDVQLTQGIEVRSSGDLVVSVNENTFDAKDRGWNLDAWRFGGQGGTLSLRAAGDVRVNGSISDGFKQGSGAMPTWALDSDAAGWNLRLTGGADMASANPLAVNALGKGDVQINFARDTGSIAPASANDVPVASVRTGTGRIDVAAGRDVSLGKFVLPDPDGDTTLDQSFGATLYTAGRAVTPATGFVAPGNDSNVQFGGTGQTAASFGAGGGGIRITAQRNVVGAAVPQLVNNWLFRQGRSGTDANGNTVFETVRNIDGSTRTLNTAWWARPDYFRTGVATLGGGDVEVVASKGSVRDLSVNVATNAYMPGSAPSANSLIEQGGGDLSVRAGGNIQGGSFYVQKGQARVRADGSIEAGSLKSLDIVASSGSTDSVYTALRPVIALGDAGIDISAGKNLEIESIYNPTLARQSVYNVDSGLNPASAFLNFNNASAQALAYKQQYAQFGSFSTYGAQSKVRLTAVGGDLVLSNNGLLVATSAGNDQPLSDYGHDYAQLFAYMPAHLDAVAISGSLRSEQGFALAPAATGSLSLLAQKNIDLQSNGILYNGVVMLDNNPATISRPDAPTMIRQSELALLRGNVNALSAHTAGQLHADDSEPVRVIAKEGSITGSADAAVSLNLSKRAEIAAGQDVRDLGFAVQHNTSGDVTTVQAGNDVVDSTNFSNSSPVKHVVTGEGLLAIQAGRNIDLGNSQGVVTRGNLDNAYLPQGGASVSALAGVDPGLKPALSNPADAASQHKALLADLVKASTKDDKLASFDALIESAYPATTVQSGNINVFGSQFKTEQGGSIDLLAPGGSVLAGLVSVPVYLQNRSAAETGIFTVRGGAIRSLVKNDFTVNQGRVFTLGGGDITLVSQDGNIDAGRGAKTAASAPPPLLTTDASGNTKIDIAGSIAGSGIATLRTSDKQESSNVYAVAPRGIFDAGDAGVRSTGSVLVNAQVVLNAANIQAAGGVSGSAISTGSLSSAAPTSNSSSQAQEATKQISTASKETLPLSVEVMGYGAGEENKDSDNSGDEQELKKKGSGNKS